MAQIDNRHDVAALEIAKPEVAKFPVVAPGAQQRLVDRRALAQVFNTQFLDEPKVFLPALLVITALHLVDTRAPTVDGGHAVFDAGTEHEVGDGTSLEIYALVGKDQRAKRKGLKTLLF